MNDELPSDEEALERLRLALVAMKLLDPSGPLRMPAPEDKATGVAGKSKVWFLIIPRPIGGELSLVAKFDTPSRAKREWDAIEHLRSINLSTAAVLPMHASVQSHGVVVYQNTAASTPSGNVVELGKLLRQQLGTNLPNCRSALASALKVLSLFYSGEPGGPRFADVAGTIGTWVEELHLGPRIEKLRADLSKTFPTVNWSTAALDSLPDAPGLDTKGLPNPIFEIERRMDERIGKVKRSRVHGDLNLSNIMIGLDPVRAPDGVFLIDLAACRPDAPTSLDFALLESELWQSVIARAAESDVDAVIRDMLVIRQSLDFGLPQPSTGLSPIARNAGLWLNDLRMAGKRVLGGGMDSYVLEDHMRALFWYDLRAVWFRLRDGDPVRARLALLGAACTRRFLDHLTAGQIERPPVLPEGSGPNPGDGSPGRSPASIPSAPSGDSPKGGGPVVNQPGQTVHGDQFNAGGDIHLHLVVGTSQPPAVGTLDAGVCAYLSAVAAACDVVWFPGFKDQGERHLLDIYADLHTRDPSNDPDADSHWRAKGQEKGERFPVLKAAAEHKALVILGPPGGGKSTFLRFLAICLARLHGCAVSGPGYNGSKKAVPKELLDRVPIWIDLPQLKNIPKSVPKDVDPFWLWNTFVQGVGELKGVPEPKPDMAASLRKIVESGRALFLLDGLDEITEPDQRDFLKAAVREFICEAFGGAEKRVIVTCRERSWFTGWQIGDWPENSPLELAVRTLTGFTAEDQAGFLAAWFRANGSTEPEKEAEQLGIELRDPVRNRGRRLEEMASSPMTLSMIAWLRSRANRQNQSLPASRAAIYEQTIQAILWNLDDHKTAEAAATTLPKLIAQRAEASGLTRQKFVEALAQIAFEAQKQSPVRGLADISLAQLESTFAKLSCPVGRSEPARTDKEWAASVLDTIQCRSGLLREVQLGMYRFQHRSFQEYLAAYYLATREDFIKQSLDWKNQPLPAVAGDNEGVKREAVEANRESLWEVLRLAVGHLAVPKEQRAKPDPDPERDRSKAMDLLFTLIEIPEGKAQRNWRDVWLGGELFEELNLGENLTHSWKALGSNVRAALVELIESSVLTPFERAAAGRALGRLGDLRKGVGVVRGDSGEIQEMFEWLPVPRKASGASMEGRPTSTTAGEPEYFVSRFLVTVAQYQTFIRDGGYRNPDWWLTPEAKAWLAGQELSGPEVYDDVRLHTPNHPQVGICFHEAQAFCAWATAKVIATTPLPSQADNPSHWEVRLPTDAQWNRAACGDDTRDYAWGSATDEELPEHCNCYSAGIRSTTAVGLFPRGRSWSGAQDMTGNVWEWCEDWYHSSLNRAKLLKKYSWLRQDDGHRTDRVLRGGSWRNGPEVLRVAYRGNNHPENRRNFIGFRCVLVRDSLPRTGL